MERYIRTETVEAEPMTADEFNNQIRPVRYSGNDSRGYRVINKNGSSDWWPKNAFEKNFKEMEEL